MRPLTGIALAFHLLVSPSAALAEEPMRLPVDASPIVFATKGGKVALDVEIADEDSERSRGLMFRTDLPKDRGMLFVNPAERMIGMWMANTPTPLDMIFMGADGQVLSVARNTEPFSPKTVSSGVPARYVLEVHAGTVDEKGLAVGDKASHPLIAPGR